MSGRMGGCRNLEMELWLRANERLTVRCVFCEWERRGRATAMLAAQRRHAEKHVGPIALSGKARTGKPVWRA
jgi:hypothetical protein